MRQLFKNDIIRLAKEIKDIKFWAVYFLLSGNEIVYVGCSQTPYVRMCQHLGNFHVDSYHMLNFGSREEALEAEKNYIKSFKPFQNTMYNDLCDKEARLLLNQEFEDTKESKAKERLRKSLINAEIKRKDQERRYELKKIFEEGQKQKEKDAFEKRLKAERVVEKANPNINIPNNTYIKKPDAFYLKIDNEVIKTKMEAECIIYKRKKYQKPTKLFGSITELLVNQ